MRRDSTACTMRSVDCWRRTLSARRSASIMKTATTKKQAARSTSAAHEA